MTVRSSRQRKRSRSFANEYRGAAAGARSRALAVLILLGAPTTSVRADDSALLATGDPAYGQYLFGGCTACHGVGSGGIPAIDGMDGKAVLAMLRAYKTGEIEHDAMNTLTQSLGDAEMAALAVYIQSLEPKE